MMGADQAWLTARHLQHVLACGDAAGVDMDAVLGKLGWTREQVQHNQARVPVALMEALLSQAVVLQQDPFIGLRLAAQVKPSTFGPLGLLVQTCATLGEMLETITRFNGLLTNFTRSELHHYPGYADFVWDCQAGSPAFQQYAAEYVLCALASLASQFTACQGGVVVEAGFDFAEPGGVGPRQPNPVATYLQCPVRYGHSHAYLRFSSKSLALAIPHADKELKILLENHLRRVWKEMLNVATDRQLPWSQRVSRVIRESGLSPPPSREMVAEILGLSARHLHRKLQQEGLSYQTVLNRVRLDQAKRLLQSKPGTVLEAAKTLGFRSHSAFQRWFKQHSGLTPGGYKNTQQSALE